MNQLSPIQLLPARDRVAAALREAILSHQLLPGRELSLKDAAQMLGVSVTPVREAFRNAGSGGGSLNCAQPGCYCSWAE